MPLFAYRCRACRHEFEVLTSSGSAEAAVCPACRDPAPDRLLGLPSVGRPSPAAPTPGCGPGPPCGAAGCGRVRPAAGVTPAVSTR